MFVSGAGPRVRTVTRLHCWDPCHHFVLSRNDQLLCFWNPVLINMMHHYGGPGSYHLLCIWLFHPDVLHNNPKKWFNSFLSCSVAFDCLPAMELKVFDIMGSVALEYQANIPTAFWICLIPSEDSGGDVSSGVADCCLAPYWIGAAVAGACWCLVGVGCCNSCRAFLTYPGTLVSRVLCW